MDIGKARRAPILSGHRSGGRIRAFVAAATMAVLGAGCSGTPVSAEGTWGIGADGAPELVLEERGKFSGVDTWLTGLDTAHMDGENLTIKDGAGGESGRLIREPDR